MNNDEDLLTVEQKFRLMVSNRPWESEPDLAEWVDEKTGYHCRIHRHQTLGHLCGYVGIPKTHKMHGVWYDNIKIKVHGGLTYAAEDKETGLWVLGFDCSHAGDFSPKLVMNLMKVMEHYDVNELGLTLRTEVYRDWAFVENEVCRLVRRLKRLEKG